MGEVTKSVARGEDLELVLGGKGGPQWAGDVDMETPGGRARRNKDDLRTGWGGGCLVGGEEEVLSGMHCSGITTTEGNQSTAGCSSLELVVL